MERNWSHRGSTYQICFVFLVFGFCPFLIGFGAPSWLFVRNSEINGSAQERSFGLWEWCEIRTETRNDSQESGSSGSCHYNVFHGNDILKDWFVIVAILQTFSLCIYLVSLSMAFIQNFAKIQWIRTLHVLRLREILHRDSEAPEDIGFLSGFLSFMSILFFMIMTADIVSQDTYYSWGFAMAFIGASVPVITGVLMCKAHIPVHVPLAPQAEPLVVHTLDPPDRNR